MDPSDRHSMGTTGWIPARFVRTATGSPYITTPLHGQTEGNSGEIIDQVPTVRLLRVRSPVPDHPSLQRDDAVGQGQKDRAELLEVSSTTSTLEPECASVFFGPGPVDHPCNRTCGSLSRSSNHTMVRRRSDRISGARLCDGDGDRQRSVGPVDVVPRDLRITDSEGDRVVTSFFRGS